MQSSEKYIQFIVRLYWGAIAILLILSAFFQKGEDVLLINGHHSHFLDEFFRQITHLGEGWIFMPVFLFSLFVRYSLSVSIVSMAILHGLACSFSKNVLFSNAPRPMALLDNHLLYFVPGVDVHTLHSFPSGHTATIFCFAVLTSILIKHRLASILILLLAIGVGYSRIYLLQHFLIDVTGGAIVGTGSAFLILALFDRANLPSKLSSGMRLRLRKT